MPTYAETERLRAAEWKSVSPTLPEGSRRPAPYGRAGSTAASHDFCLPSASAANVPARRQRRIDGGEPRLVTLIPDLAVQLQASALIARVCD